MDGDPGDRTVRIGDAAAVALGHPVPVRSAAAGRPAPDRTVPLRRPGTPALVVSAAVIRPPAAPQPVAAPAIQTPVPRAAPVAAPAPAPGRPGEWAARLVERLHLVQVVCWQVAVLAIVLAVRASWPVLLSAVAAAAVLLGLTGVRVRGRWGYQLAGLWLRFQLRPRRHELPSDAGKASALMELLLPGATARTVRTGQGAALAISHQCGLTAMVRPRSLTPDQVGSFPDPAALLPASEQQPHELAVRTVFHSGPAPGAPTGVWLAVHAARTADTVLDEELTLVLHNGLRRVRRALQRAGVPTEPLPEDAALAAITTLAHVTDGVREDWRFVRTGPLSQACFALDGWHRLAAGHARWLVPRVLGRTGGVEATLTSTAGTTAGGTRSRALLRLAAPTEVAVDRTAGGVAGLLAPAGVGLVRLDGGHLRGVAATLPIGGFPT